MKGSEAVRRNGLGRACRLGGHKEDIGRARLSDVGHGLGGVGGMNEKEL